MTSRITRKKKNEKNWIKDAIKRPGSLRKKLGKKDDEKITMGDIRSQLSKLKKKATVEQKKIIKNFKSTIKSMNYFC